jgi:hypothetical protein
MNLRIAGAAVAGLTLLSLAACEPKLEGGPSAGASTPPVAETTVPPLNVPSPVTLTPPSTPIKAGQPFTIGWSGPGGADDYIDIVATGHEPVGDELSYTKVATGNPVTITAPAQPGSYDLRYVQDQGGRTIIGRITVTVSP